MPTGVEVPIDFRVQPGGAYVAVHAYGNALSHTTTFATNAAGQMLAVTDPLSKVIEFGYAEGDLVSVETPLGHTMTRFTDAAGRLISVTDALGHRTRFDYNAHEQITKITDPKGGETSFAFFSARGAPTPARGGSTRFARWPRPQALDGNDTLLTRNSSGPLTLGTILYLYSL